MSIKAVVISKSLTDVYVKFYGVDGTASLNLTTDMLGDNEELDGPIQKVNIVSLFWTGDLNAVSYINRNNERIFTLQANTVSNINLSEQGFRSDPTNNTFGFDFAQNSVQGECWIKLKKMSGYKRIKQPYMP